MLRIFHAGKLEKGAEICRADDDAHHLFRVLRAKPGERIAIFNGQGYRARAHVIDSSSQKIIINDLEYATPPKIILFPALLENKAMDLLLREATAIGVARIIPLLTQNSAVKIQNIIEKQIHWNRIAREACKQSGNPDLPTIEIPQQLMALQLSTPTFVAALREDAENIFTYQSEMTNNPIALLISPEGNFSEQEYQYLAQNNVHIVRLGKHILRAETAALYLLSTIDHILSSDSLSI